MQAIEAVENVKLEPVLVYENVKAWSLSFSSTLAYQKKTMNYDGLQKKVDPPKKVPHWSSLHSPTQYQNS